MRAVLSALIPWHSSGTDDTDRRASTAPRGVNHGPCRPSLVTWFFDYVDRLRQRRVEVHLRVHRAWFVSPPGLECYFLNIWNASPERAVTVTHDSYQQEGRLRRRLGGSATASNAASAPS